MWMCQSNKEGSIQKSLAGALDLSSSGAMDIRNKNIPKENINAHTTAV